MYNRANLAYNVLIVSKCLTTNEVYKMLTTESLLCQRRLHSSGVIKCMTSNRYHLFFFINNNNNYHFIIIIHNSLRVEATHHSAYALVRPGRRARLYKMADECVERVLSLYAYKRLCDAVGRRK